MWTDWSETLVSKLRELKLLGLSCADIGSLLGVSKNSVIGKWNRLGESAPDSPATRSDNARRGGRAARRKVAKTPKPPKIRPAALPAAPPAPYCMPPARGTGLDALLNLKPDDCRWPIGLPGSPEFRFCGAQRGRGSMYCDHHYVASIKPENGHDKT